MSISESRDGHALLCCHAGCTTAAICAALNLTLADLMLNGHNGAPRAAGPGRRPQTFPSAAAAVAHLEATLGPRAAWWQYDGPDGEPVGAVVRWNNPDGTKRTIRPVARHPDGWRIGAMPTPRPLYALGELRAAPRVYVVEGERCCEALRALGLTATTSAGGAQAAKQTDWAPLAARDVVIFPDHDEPGRRYARDIEALLALLNPWPTTRVVELPGLADGGDVFDFIAARRAAGPDDATIKAELEALADAAPVVERDEPVTRDELVWRPFPVDALPPRVRVFVKAVAGATNTDASWSAVACLAVLAGCIGNRACARARRGWDEPAVLWAALVGRSGTIKSAVVKLVTRALHDLYKHARAEHRDALREYDRAMARHAVDYAKWKQDQRKGTATDPPLEPEQPIERRVLVSDTTVEKLGVLLQENPLGLLLVRDELAAWLGSFDRYAGGGKGSDQPTWLSMFDAAPVTIDRKSAVGTIYVALAAVSVLGSIQPGTLLRMFGRAEREAGLLARVLLVCPPERPALWADAELSDTHASDWRALLDSLLAIEPAQDDDGNPRPRVIPLSTEALAAFRPWHDAHVRELRDIGDDDLQAHVSKLKGIAVRLALIFELTNAADTGTAVVRIGAEALRHAVVVADWFKAEAARVYGQFAETDDDRDRRRLVELIRQHGGTVTVRDLMRACRRFQTADDAEAALQGLAADSLGQWVNEPPGPAGGHPVRRFELRRADSADTARTPSAPEEYRGCVPSASVSTPHAAADGAPDDDRPPPPTDDDAAAAGAGDWGEV